MGVASVSTSTRSCHTCQEGVSKKRNQANAYATLHASTMSELRSDISMADIDSKDKAGENHNALTKLQKIKEKYRTVPDREKNLTHERESNMSEVLRRATALRESRLKLMQNAASQHNDPSSAKSRLTLTSRLPLHEMRKEDSNDAAFMKKVLQREKAKDFVNAKFDQQIKSARLGIEATETEDSKAKYARKMVTSPKEMPGSTNSEDQSKWFSDYADPTLSEQAEFRGNDRVAINKYRTETEPRVLNDNGSATVSKTPNMSAIETPAKLAEMRVSAQRPVVKPSWSNSSAWKQRSKPDATSKGSHTQPKMPSYFSKATMTEDVAMWQFDQVKRRNCTYASQGTQTDDVASRQASPSETITLSIRAAQQYSRKVDDKHAVASISQAQRAKPVMVSMGTQTDDIPSVEMDSAVKGEKEAEWEDMDLGRKDEAEDADWEFVDM